MALKIPAYLSGFSSKVDGSASIRFNTQELGPDDYSLLQKHLSQFGWLLFAESDLKAADIPKEEIHEDESKSPSKRLRAVLFVKWKQLGTETPFDLWYNKAMNGIIEQWKKTLD